MDVHTIGHIGMWVSFATLLVSAPLGVWWISSSAR